uniref:Apolipoprotein D n=1 Tax=Labrus bergylta TaxID=56723 RepID=A0A3Q3EFH9_9LABR
MAASAQMLRFGKCPKPPVQANFDSSRVNMNHLFLSFQKGECGTATYSPKSPGVIGVLNRELKDGSINFIVGSAKVKHPSEPAKLEVSFTDIPSPPGPYWVLSSDYETHSLVYGCSDFGLFRLEFAWILSREPTMSEETLQSMQSILSAAGVNPEKMVATNQDETYCDKEDEKLICSCCHHLFK